MALRLLSHSEVATALTCWARHAFAYTGHLTDGHTLESKEIAPRLSEGRAWGAGVATWHMRAGELTALWDAHEALRASLDKDAADMLEVGLPPLSSEVRMEMENRLGAMLDHYSVTAEPLYGLTRLEEGFVVGVPSRAGTRASSRYRFSGYIDGWQDEGPWIVEFKLRGRLTEPALLERQRQPRWYAWAYAQRRGVQPLGVIIDERLNEAPRPPRTVQGRKKGEGRKPSHAKDQLCTPEAYEDLCLEHGELPKTELLELLRQREWQRRFPIVFRPGELDEAGRELVSAAKLIRDLDSGELAPVRNASRATCGSCRFREICSNPTDDLFVGTLFRRTVPKRLRPREESRMEGTNPTPAQPEQPEPPAPQPEQPAAPDQPEQAGQPAPQPEPQPEGEPQQSARETTPDAPPAQQA